jgi:hypothetical protein
MKMSQISLWVPLTEISHKYPLSILEANDQIKQTLLKDQTLWNPAVLYYLLGGMQLTLSNN